MKTEKDNYYLYRHIRLDTGEPFYIGIGKVYTPKVKDCIKYYSRAFQTTKRNRFWKFIFEKTEYEVEILFETDNRDKILQKEIEFIALHGRRDLGKGTLVNLTDGGDGMSNNKQSEETLEKRRKMYAEGRTGLKPMIGEDSPRAVKVVEVATGKIFPSITSAAKYLGIHSGEMHVQLTHSKNRSNKTGFKFLDESLNKEHKSNKRDVKIYNYNSNSIINSILEASKVAKISRRHLKAMLTGLYTNTTNMVYYEDFLRGIKPEDLYIDKKVKYKVINTETKEVYPSMSFVSRKIGSTKSAFENRIKGKVFNETPYQLLEDYKKGLPINWNVEEKVKPEKKLIDSVTGEIYNSILEASQELSINYNTLANYLNPKCPNKNLTNLDYLTNNHF